MPKQKKRKSFICFTSKFNFNDNNIDNLHFYEYQPRFIDNGRPDDFFVKVRITIEEI